MSNEGALAGLDDGLDDGQREVSAAELAEEGVYSARLSADEGEYEVALAQLAQRRGYLEQDVVALSPDTPGLEALCASFVAEHAHDDDEVRFVLAGAGVFDIRSRDDRRMRVAVEPGDLLVVPAGRHHRFMLTERKTIRCVRLFKDRSGWVPRYREPPSAE